MPTGELDALLAITLVPGLGPLTTRRCLDAFGSASAFIAADAAAFMRVEGVGPKKAADLRAALDAVVRDKLVDRERELIAAQNARIIALNDPHYPALLKHIPDPPPALFVRGELRENDTLAVAIVGSRECTTYGREQADRFSAFLAQAGLCVVSGGAYGIDAAAHRAALRVHGRTIAVIGSGLARPYPKEHASLFDQIAAEGGAVISELPMTTPPMKDNFPSRNRIISGLSLGVLVIEAADRSGALITARVAAEDHHREVMALPGRVDSPASVGCNRILRDGWAKLVTTPAEALDALEETGHTVKGAIESTPDHPLFKDLATNKPHAKPKSDRPADAPDAASMLEQNLTDSQRRILAALDGETLELDRLSAATRLPVSQLNADLTMLQIRGLVTRSAGKWTRRKR